MKLIQFVIAFIAFIHSPNALSAVYVSGEVDKESTIEYSENLTLGNALSKADGMTRLAHTVFLRRERDGVVDILLVRMNEIEESQEILEEPLMDGDMIHLGLRSYWMFPESWHGNFRRSEDGSIEFIDYKEWKDKLVGAEDLR